MPSPYWDHLEIYAQDFKPFPTCHHLEGMFQIVSQEFCPRFGGMTHKRICIYPEVCDPMKYPVTKRTSQSALPDPLPTHPGIKYFTRSPYCDNAHSHKSKAGCSCAYSEAAGLWKRERGARSVRGVKIWNNPTTQAYPESTFFTKS